LTRSQPFSLHAWISISMDLLVWIYLVFEKLAMKEAPTAISRQSYKLPVSSSLHTTRIWIFIYCTCLLERRYYIISKITCSLKLFLFLSRKFSISIINSVERNPSLTITVKKLSENDKLWSLSLYNVLCHLVTSSLFYLKIFLSILFPKFAIWPSVVVMDNRQSSKKIISTNCCIHTVVPPDDGPGYAWNM
jgi:hypothetical protein